MTSRLGENVRRREDAALIVGAGRFAADTAPGAAAMVVVRSPYAHARLIGVRLDAARAMPGVLAAWSAADAPLEERHLPDPQVPGIAHRPRPVLAGEAVRYQGEPVAVVVAETEAQAVDAVDVVDVVYDRLPGAGGAAAGQLAGVTTLAFGDVEAAFATAPVTIRRRLLASRVTGAAIEPRACAAVPVAGRRLLLHASTQWPHGVRDAVARSLRMDPSMIDVVAEDVGGAFGGKGFPYPEEVLVAAAACALERPVRWVATRGEDGASTCQAHGTEIEVEAAADADGRLLGLRARFLHDCGAYTAAAFAQAENLAGHMLSMYRVRALRADVEFRVTNTAPARFIRGGARPIGNLAVERAMDALADRLGMDRVEIRRRNLLAPRELPFAHGLRVNGRRIVVDGSSYLEMLDAAVAAIGGPDEPGTGWGVACGIESSGMGRPTAAELALTADGMLTVKLGSAPRGQGHRTAFAQLAAARLGWPLERVTVVAGDTRIGPPAAQTAASRSAIEFGNATAMAATSLRRRLLDLASERFRGVGEAGTIPAPAAILSAIESALHSLGRDAQLSVIPATPERVARASGGAQEV